MKYRFTACLTAMAAAVCTLCAPLSSAATYPFQTGCSYYYDQFDSHAQKLYDDLLVAAQIVDDSDKDYMTAPMVYYSGIDYEQMRDTVHMFGFDHPEFFWLSNSYSYGYDAHGNFIELEVYADYQKGSARQAAKEQLIAIEQQYIDTALTYDTDYARAKYLSEQLYKDITYSSGSLDQSIASALLQKKTVCAGFTKSYSLLANAVGVDTITFVSPDHGWNATKIADIWYHNDVTNRMFLYSDSEMKDVDAHASKTIVTDSNGNQTVYGMHDKYYYYYDSIFPDTSRSYNGESTVMTDLPAETTPAETPPAETTEPPTETTTESTSTEPAATEPTTTETVPADPNRRIYYEATCSPIYFFAQDTGTIDPIDLIDTLWHVDETITANYSSRSSTSVHDLSGLQLEDPGLTPAQLFESRPAGASYFHGTLSAAYFGEPLEIGDVWVIRRGDFDGDGLTNAADATAVLLYAAALGAGDEGELPEGIDPALSLFAGKLTDDGAPPNAGDATEILVYAAMLGAGNVND